MTINRIYQFISPLQAYADKQKFEFLKYGAAGLLGYLLTAKIVNELAHRHPFLDKLERPLCIAGALSVMAITHVSLPFSLPLAFVAACIAYAAAAIYIMSCPPPTEYTSETFKQLLFNQKRFPPGPIIVKGNLSLSNRTSLTSLPQGLHVKGYFHLHGCTGLASLPQELDVEGALNLSHCTSLISLPQDLHVGGDLNFFNCISLTSLPSWITTLGPRSNGRTREVDLSRTGLSQDIIERLRQADAPGMRFYFSHAAAKPEQIFNTLDDALTFWKKAACTDHLLPTVELDGDDLDNILTFLGRLTATAEYNNLQARPVLARRILEAFDLMASNNGIKDRIIEIIRDGLTSCDDRIISALDNIELMMHLRHIDRPDVSEKELSTFGRSLLLLELVNKKANAHALTLTWVDEIEIHLAFQIGLAERFKLPISTRNMIFRQCAQITDQQIQAAGDDIEKECTPARLDAFLVTWDPWTKYQRRCSDTPYERLPMAQGRRLQVGERCSILQFTPTNPVLYGGQVYDYEAFIEVYVNNGTDPLTRKPIDWNQLKRLQA